MLNREYIVFRSCNLTSSDPYDDERVRSYDQLLYRTLSAIFQESCLTSGQIKQLLRTPKKRNNKNYIFKLIVEREPALDQLVLKRNKLSLLWIAVLSCYQKSAELLVRYGADVNERYGLDSSSDELLKKSTVLHALLLMHPSAWNERFIGMVIDNGADLKARDSDDCSCTVLHLAVEYGRVKVVKLLLEKGADVNAVRRDGVTPLHDVARSSKANELMPLLMRHGADIKARDTEGKNALHHLVSAPVENVDLARVLIEEGVSVNDRTRAGQFQPIHLAVFKGYNELVKLFLDHGSNVNARMIYGDFPLKLASECNNPAVLLTLLERGANINLRDNHGRTTLYIACENSNLEKIKILLSVGADVFIGDRVGLTPCEVICKKSLMENPSTGPMLKMLALGMACRQTSTEFKNEEIIKEMYPAHWNYYQDCVEEINRTKSTRFVATCTFFELLTKCQCRIAALMHNHEFESKFRLCDLGVFPMYAKDILEAFLRAKAYYQFILDLEDAINEAADTHLPYVVMRKLIGFAVTCEFCEMKKIAQASTVAPAGSDKSN